MKTFKWLMLEGGLYQELDRVFFMVLADFSYCE